MGEYSTVNDCGDDARSDHGSDITVKEPQESDVTEVAKEDEHVSTLEASKQL